MNCNCNGFWVFLNAFCRIQILLFCLKCVQVCDGCSAFHLCFLDVNWTGLFYFSAISSKKYCPTRYVKRGRDMGKGLCALPCVSLVVLSHKWLPFNCKDELVLCEMFISRTDVIVFLSLHHPFLKAFILR